MNFKTSKISFSRKKITSYITNKQIVCSAQYWKIFFPNCFTKQKYWRAKLLFGALSKPDHCSIKIKLAIAHLSELPLLTKVSVDIGCIIWSTIQVCCISRCVHICIGAILMKWRQDLFIKWTYWGLDGGFYVETYS